MSHNSSFLSLLIFYQLFRFIPRKTRPDSQLKYPPESRLQEYLKSKPLVVFSRPSEQRNSRTENLINALCCTERLRQGLFAFSSLGRT
ncbi:MAG: hypothetical protein OP8BY_0155 [Candidatus Saccharicenans subterraneus]|uniref:Uncharacterized protein n=1 Tax=Candidatus Saccharicenans subterraneus TaxID=2508984 RepID=A0A3E2BLJ2_9BACT|nr:MAG: hypothetical protein OP8BY_0155 [Candidatus Saccharicenans subterraneum]